MSKYTADITIGWLEQNFEGDTPNEIMKSVEKVQDFECLLRMGREEEDKKGQKELDKLESFLQKYYEGELTIDDIRSLNIKLSIGDIVCNEVTENN